MPEVVNTSALTVEDETAEIEDPDHGKSETDIIDEITGQMKLF